MENESKLDGLIWLGTAIIFISVLSVIVIVIIHQNRILKVKDQQSKAKLDAALESEKQERSRIASDLHDGVSGDLNAVRNYIAIMSKTLEGTEAIHLINDMEEAVENAVANVQCISYNLMPPLLQSHGLISTLQSFFSRVRKSQNILINEVYEMDFVNMSSQNAYEMYRIVQELISNTVKHGKANHLVIQLTIDVDRLLISITDNGKEFNLAENLKSSRGMGLKNIAARMMKLNASLEHEFLNQHNVTKLKYHVTDRDC